MAYCFFYATAVKYVLEVKKKKMPVELAIEISDHY